jgi:hypothetical protein
MSKPIEANFWTEHLLKQDASLDFVKAGGSLVRFPIAENDKAHRSLVSALRSAKEQNQLAFFTVPSHACEIHRPDKVLSELASRWNTESYATAVIRNVWKELRYDASESILLSDASRATGQDPNPMFSRFNRNLRDLLGRGLNNQGSQLNSIRFNRDFANGAIASMISLIEGDDTELKIFEAWLRGERLTAADRRSIGIMWPVKRDNATSILRSMLAFSALAGWTGSILHFDIRFVTDHAKYDEINSPNTYTKQKRIALYQWLREIIDQTQHFSKTVIVVETGPTFIDQSQFGIGIGIYDALKNRIVDDVSLNDSAVANPCAIVVPISGDSYVR